MFDLTGVLLTFFLYQIEELSESVWTVHHNLKKAKDTSTFEVEYIHPVPLKCGDFFEVRIEDLGEKYAGLKHKGKFEIGIGVRGNSADCGGSNREMYGFDIGYMAQQRRSTRLQVR